MAAPRREKDTRRTVGSFKEMGSALGWSSSEPEKNRSRKAIYMGRSKPYQKPFNVGEGHLVTMDASSIGTAGIVDK